jgi:TPP-dependent 2-oxoacid decarboxylase
MSLLPRLVSRRPSGFFEDSEQMWCLGTSSFGILDVPMPDKSVFVSQILFGSIGWATGKFLLQFMHRAASDGIDFS